MKLNVPDDKEIQENGGEGKSIFQDIEFMHKLTPEEERIIIAGISAIFNPDRDKTEPNSQILP